MTSSPNACWSADCLLSGSCSSGRIFAAVSCRRYLAKTSLPVACHNHQVDRRTYASCWPNMFSTQSKNLACDKSQGADEGRGNLRIHLSGMKRTVVPWECQSTSSVQHRGCLNLPRVPVMNCSNLLRGFPVPSTTPEEPACAYHGYQQSGRSGCLARLERHADEFRHSRHDIMLLMRPMPNTLGQKPGVRHKTATA